MKPPIPKRLPGSYWRQWTASAISNLGDGVTFVAMPLVALSLTRDERLLALVTLVTFLPWIAVALPVGSLVDRVDRQVLMVSANLVRVAMLTVIAIAAATGNANIWVLLVLIAVIGCCEVVFDSSAQAFLPLLVDHAQLARANGLLYAAEIVAGSIAGLSIGALLFEVDVGLPFGVDAISFAVAALLIATIRTGRGGVIAGNQPLGSTSLSAGLRWLFHDELLRTLALMFTMTNLGLMFGQGIFVKYSIDELGLGNVEYGILLAITAMGAAAGGILGDLVIRRVGLRGSVVGPYVIFGAAQLVLGVVPPAWVVACAGFVLGAAITVWNVATVTIRQRTIPPELFGRVNGVYRWLGAVASATGVAAGGFVAHATDLRTPFIVGGTLALGAAILFARPVLRAIPNDL